MIKKAIQFFKEVKIELKKTTWPKRPEVINSTIIVIVATIAVTLFLYFCDIVLARLIGVIIK